MVPDVVIEGDNLEVLTALSDEQIDLIYIDPPFNTGKQQKMMRVQTLKDGEKQVTGEEKYWDVHENYHEWLRVRLVEMHRVLKKTGSIYVHLDWREVHNVRFLMDEIFGKNCYLNEIIWAYDYGARQKRKWPTKHDNILVYVKDEKKYYFNTEEVDRIPYMSPSLVGPIKTALGKLPTDVWWHTIVPTNGKERTGYPNQKPAGILRRIVAASCPPDGIVADFFAGSGTTGIVAKELDRKYLLVDNNSTAIRISKERLG